MGISTMLILALFGLVAFIIWKYHSRRRIHERIEKYAIQDHTQQVESLSDLGEHIIAQIRVSDPLPPEESQTIPNVYAGKVKWLSNQGESIEIRQTLPPIRLDQELRPLVEQVVNVMVGKYILDDRDVIKYLRRATETVLEHISHSKPNHQILGEYDPKFSNDLLLEACRDLFEYPHLDHMKKLLVGQFIVNKSTEMDEIDTVYNYIKGVALDGRISATTRMNASDILNLSNNRRYMGIANKALELLRQEGDAPRALAKPTGGQKTTYIGRDQQERRLPPRITELPHRRPHNPFTGIGREERGERNDLFIIPPIIGEVGDQQRIWDQATRGRAIPKTERTVYEDSQSVHNTGINESVLEAAKELVAGYRSGGQINFDYSTIKDNSNRIKIEAAIHRITTDPTTFKHGTTLYGIFQSLQTFIAQSPHRDELNTRLLQELTEMSGLCASGHLARMINVIQGFEVKPEFKVRVKIDDEVYATIKHSIDKALVVAEDSDKLIDDLTSIDKSHISRFAEVIARVELPSIQRAYQGTVSEDEVKQGVIKALDKYTSTSGKFHL